MFTVKGKTKKNNAPNDFDIFLPSESRTREWQYTSRKGISPTILSPSMIILHQTVD